MQPDLDERCAYYLTLYGKVQGVGFRRKLRSNAKKLGLVGWVSNSPQGYVEAVLQGQLHGVREIIAQIHNGVYEVILDDCVISKIGLSDIQGFAIIKKNKAYELLGVKNNRLCLLDRELRSVGRIVSKTMASKKSGIEKELSQILTNLPRRYWLEPMKKHGPVALIRKNSASFSSELWSHRLHNDALKTYIPHE